MSLEPSEETEHLVRESTCLSGDKILGTSFNLWCAVSFDQELAVYAESHIEEPDAPLFLRFINLLVNDATFLLDEALSVSLQ